MMRVESLLLKIRIKIFLRSRVLSPFASFPGRAWERKKKELGMYFGNMFGTTMNNGL